MKTITTILTLLLAAPAWAQQPPAIFNQTYWIAANVSDPETQEISGGDVTFEIWLEDDDSAPVADGPLALLTTGLYSGSIDLTTANGFEIGRTYILQRLVEIAETLYQANPPIVFTVQSPLPEVNVTQIFGEDVTLQAAENLISFFDNDDSSTAQVVDDVGSGGATADDVWTYVAGGGRSLTADVGVSSIGANVITATSIHSNAIDAIQSGLATSTDISGLNDISVADVWEYVLTEMQAGEPDPEPEAGAALAALWRAMTGKWEVTATTKTLFDSNGDPIFVKALSDDGTTFTEAEAAAVEP